ncbi:hypothetical protein F3Y22_tig00111758pilonHSYRG00089 [Hibiscus syriacus]|uniref:RNase H type-1 domain-containing protein n=1 Tax=Hibiscus syriacus TaxID=106335 RepID=A0A6A2YE57_HIBSY|nr:hypothetical protein F3Y22_tig00111758pilonHSYRG00089 [Hibiscus syriacus]
MNLEDASGFVIEKENWDIMFGAIVWNTWLPRNEVTFNNPAVDTRPILIKCRQLVDLTCRALDMNRIHQGPSRRPIVGPRVWSFPPEGWVKMNSDGARCRESEIWGVYTGLSCAWEIGSSNVIIEVDSMELLGCWISCKLETIELVFFITLLS